MINDYIFKLSDGEELDIDLYGADLPVDSPLIVYVHGFKGFKDWGFVHPLAEYLSERGFVVLTFNFSHNGVGRGSVDFNELDKFSRNTFSREVEELSQLIDVLSTGSSGTRKSDRIGLLGHSRGGAITLLAAARKPQVKAVATWSSVSHLDRYSPQQIESWRQCGHFEVINQRTKQVLRLGIGLLEDVEQNIRGSLNIEKAVRSLQRPLFVVHGEQDESVPASEAGEIVEWSDRSSSELLLVRDQGHTFGVVHPYAGSNPSFDVVLERTEAFFRKHLS